MVWCFVPECKHSSLNQNRPCNHFWRFPKNEALKKKWIKSIRRGDKEPSKNVLVCSCHFKDEKKENGPTIFKRNAAKLLTCTASEKQKRKFQRLEEANLLSPSSEGTFCSKSTTNAIDETTFCDKCPSLLLQLQEMKKENEILHAQVENLWKIAFTDQTRTDTESEVLDSDTEDDDNIFKPIPNMTVYASNVFQFSISEGTSCRKSTTNAIDEKTSCDKCLSLLLQLQEMKKENEILHARVEILRKIAFPFQTRTDTESEVLDSDTEDDNEIFKPIPDMTIYASKVFQFRISKVTSCSKSSTNAINENTSSDKCPSLVLELQEMKKENEILHARVEILREIAFPFQTRTDTESKVQVFDTEDDDEIFKPIPDITVYATKVFQFRISLCFNEPEVWRRIQVPADFNFRELHLAIQCAMGWKNYYLYKFKMVEESEVGNILDGDNIICAKTIKLPQYFDFENSFCLYVYDFGKDWMHSVEFEEVLPKIEGQTYPRCVGGEITCPPEDGVYPPSDNEDDEETKKWKRKMKDPYSFDYKTVEFNFELIDNDF